MDIAEQHLEATMKLLHSEYSSPSKIEVLKLMKCSWLSADFGGRLLEGYKCWEGLAKKGTKADFAYIAMFKNALKLKRYADAIDAIEKYRALLNKEYGKRVIRSVLDETQQIPPDVRLAVRKVFADPSTPE